MDVVEYIASMRKKDENFKIKVLRMKTIGDLIKENLACMFKYENLPDSIPEEYIERFFIENGEVAIWRLEEDEDKAGNKDYVGQLIVTTCDLGSTPDPYGRGTVPICTTLNGTVVRFEDGFERVAVGHNNKLHKNDMDIIYLASRTLTELLTSLDTNTIYSRDKKIFKAHDDKTKKAIEEAYNSVYDDKPIIVVSDNILPQLEGMGETIDMIDMTDVKNSDKLQYIVKAVDDVMRWLYTLYGQAVQNNGKMAQQSIEEIQGTTSTSFIIPNERLEMRRKWIDEVNAKFGTDITVDFSEAWKVEEIKYQAAADINEDGELEEMTEDGDPEENVSHETSEETEEKEEKEDE